MSLTGFLLGRWRGLLASINHRRVLASAPAGQLESALTDWTRSVQAPTAFYLDCHLTTRFEPPLFATKGHPGPSRVAAEIDGSQFEEVPQVDHNRVFRKP